MTDIKVLQPGDLNTRHFKNDGGNANGGVSVKVSPDADNALEVTDNGLKVSKQTSSGGLDCAAIANLSAESWSPGTSLLAQKQDGTCYRMQAPGDIFSDVGVAASFSAQSGPVGSPVTLEVRVTNVSPNQAGQQRLVVTAPQTGFTLSGAPTVERVGAGTVDATGSYEFLIDSINPGGVVTVKYTIVPDVSTFYSSLQFGARVTAVNGTDANTLNNHTSATYFALATIDPTLDPFVDCAALTMTDTTLNKPLIPFVYPKLSATVTSVDFLPAPFTNTHGSTSTGNASVENIYFATGSFRNRSFRIPGAGTITIVGVVANTRGMQRGNFAVSNTAQRVTPAGTAQGTIAWSARIDLTSNTLLTNNPQMSDKLLVPGTDYTYDGNTGVLTFLTDVYAFKLFARPPGANCRWQVFAASCTHGLDKCTVSGTGVVSVDPGLAVLDGISDGAGLWAPRVNAMTGELGRFVTGYTSINAIEMMLSPIASITHRKGAAKTYDITTSCSNYLNGSTTAGRVAISTPSNTTARVVVSAAAVPEDSVKLARVHVTVVD